MRARQYLSSVSGAVDERTGVDAPENRYRLWLQESPAAMPVSVFQGLYTPADTPDDCLRMSLVNPFFNLGHALSGDVDH